MKGGESFITTNTTIETDQENMLMKLVEYSENGKFKVNKTEEGEIFIDRDPKKFSLILDYLRTKKLNPLYKQNYTKELLMDEFDFYSIPWPFHLNKRIDIPPNLLDDQNCLFALSFLEQYWTIAVKQINESNQSVRYVVKDQSQSKNIDSKYKICNTVTLPFFFSCNNLREKYATLFKQRIEFKEEYLNENYVVAISYLIQINFDIQTNMGVKGKGNYKMLNLDLIID